MGKTLSIIYSTNAKPVVMGPKFAAFVASAAERAGYAVALHELSTKDELERFCQTQPGLVFLGMKYVYDNSEKVLTTDILKKYDIMHTNSPDSMRYDLDKKLAKQTVADAGIATAKAAVVRSNDDLSAVRTLTPPLFIKPVDAGGAMGVDELSYSPSLDEALENIQKKLPTVDDSGLLVEEFLPGREYSVGVINETAETQLVAGVLIGYGETDGQFLTPEIKRNKTGQYLQIVDQTEREEVSAFALASYRALRCDGYARIDMRRDASGALNFLEINLIPGLGDAGIIMTTAFENEYGFSKDEVVQKIIAYAELRAKMKAEG